MVLSEVNMSVIVFELTEDHVKLLKNLRWSMSKDNIVVGVANEGDEIAPPFGETNLYEAMEIILDGKPEDFNPYETEDLKEYTNEQRAKWDKLYSELPMALDLVLFNGNYELGVFKTRYHLRDWKKKN